MNQDQKNPIADNDNNIIRCPRCKHALPIEQINKSAFQCPSCRYPIELVLFPAFFKKRPEPISAEHILISNQSGCFYHPNKKAVVTCSRCGRFLCALCDVLFNNQHICPQCLETSMEKGKIEQLENSRVLYDNIALMIAILPMPFIFPTIASAPAVIYIVIRYWKAPLSILPRTRMRFIMAFFIATLQIVGWGFFFYNIFNFYF